jgi:hypothetical protein
MTSPKRPSNAYQFRISSLICAAFRELFRFLIFPKNITHGSNAPIFFSKGHGCFCIEQENLPRDANELKENDLRRLTVAYREQKNTGVPRPPPKTSTRAERRTCLFDLLQDV